MPDAPNSDVAKLEASDVATNSAAKTAAGIISRGFLLLEGSIAACVSPPSVDLLHQYWNAQITNPAAARPTSGPAKIRASVRLKMAVIAAILKYMMPVARGMPARGWRWSG